MQTHRHRSVAAPESFVVRIYRRDPLAPTRIAGTVEVVASGNELSFTGLRELQVILTAAWRAGTPVTLPAKHNPRKQP